MPERKLPRFLTLGFELAGIGVVILALIIFAVRPSGERVFQKKARNDNITSGANSENLVNKIKSGKSYNEIKAASAGVAAGLNISPNISSKKIKAEIEKDKSYKQANYSVIFDGKTLFPENLSINQTDIVTWKNTGDVEILIKGEDWGSEDPIFTGKSFSQEFDFAGKFQYFVTSLNSKSSKEKINQSGEIVVVASLNEK